MIKKVFIVFAGALVGFILGQIFFAFLCLIWTNCPFTDPFLILIENIIFVFLPTTAGALLAYIFLGDIK